MQNVYNTTAILDILKTFNVNQVVISGITDFDLINIIFNYDATYIEINTNGNGSINDNPLNVLPNLGSYDAIFINDDANWFTVLNELKIIKKTNKEFPLVFILNNNFPNKRRDSYINPDKIPKEFRQEYTNELPICYNNKQINIIDGFFHAFNENTPKNGVLTAIEDFLDENSYIGLFKINSLKEICILYPKSQINQKRISIIAKNIQNKEMDNISLSDKLVENQLLISHIEKYISRDENLSNYEVEISKKDNIINDYKNKVKIQKDELDFKNTQISGFESNLSLKDSQIKNIRSKLVNKDKKIIDLENQLVDTNDDLDSLAHEIDSKDIKINTLEIQLETINEKNVSLVNELHDTNNKINNLIDDFEQLESYYSNQVNQKEQNLKNNKEDYENQIKIKDGEICSLKEDLVLKEDNFAIKEKDFNNQIENHKHKLNVNEKRLNSFEQSYIKQSAKIANDEYCISCFKDKISNNRLEINYLKNNNLTKKILSPISYFLILKSNPKEISLNIKLYRYLKDSKCFDIGFYLNKNKDLIGSKWCRYFSPELHYVCKGFDENRVFNKKYFKRTSKKDLLEYLLTCNE